MARSTGPGTGSTVALAFAALILVVGTVVYLLIP